MSQPILIPDLAPGDPQWVKVMSASKIAAVVGLSRYESRYSLWQLMAGNVEPQPNNAILERGHYLEPAIAEWFADQLDKDERLPAATVITCGTYAHPEHADHVASPDRVMHGEDCGPEGCEPFALLELKSGQNDWEWGETGTDQIPIGYRCQVQWQLYVMDLPVAYVACITSRLEFRWYRVERDDEDIAYLVREADAFLASVAASDEPDVDSSEHTYNALREIHPDIDGTTVELPAALAAEWIEAQTTKKAAETVVIGVRNRIAKHMGNAQYAEFAHTTYARRQAKKGGTPYVVTPNGLIEKEAETAA